MKIDLSLPLTSDMTKDANNNLKISLSGHLGTHFDVMNKVFPLEYTEREGIVFDISEIKDREIEISDVDLSLVQRDYFVGFCSKYIEKYQYGTKEYFKDHPELSKELIDALLDKGISIIGIDFAGVRRSEEHTPTDQYCADNGVFIIENLVNLKELTDKKVLFHTYPLNYVGASGLPCRVIADI